MKKLFGLLSLCFIFICCSCDNSAALNSNVDNDSSNVEESADLSDSTSDLKEEADLENSMPPTGDEQENVSSGNTSGCGGYDGHELFCEEKLDVFAKNNVTLTISYGYRKGILHVGNADSIDYTKEGAVLFFVNLDEPRFDISKYLPLAIDAIEDEEGEYEGWVHIGKSFTMSEFVATDRYVFEEINGELIFNHSETFVIPESLFVEGEGKLVICFGEYCGKTFFGAGSVIKYECADGIVTIKEFNQ